VTGAAGFIGSEVTRRLLAADRRVIAYDNFCRGLRGHLPDDPQVSVVEGDIRDRRRLDEAIGTAKPDCVVHLAAMHFIPDCEARPAEALEVNVEGTRHVFESCRGRAVRNVVFASTAAVYAPEDRPHVEETSPLGPLEIYGESKVRAEQLAQAFFDDTGITTSVLRLFNAVGIRETNPHVIPHIFESLKRSLDGSLDKSGVVRLGNVQPRRDYVDVRDIADAVLAVLARSRGHQVFNVGTGTAHSIADVVNHLRVLLDRPVTVVVDAERVRTTDRMLLVADVAKIRGAVGWTPRITLEESLEELVRHYGLL